MSVGDKGVMSGITREEQGLFDAQLMSARETMLAKKRSASEEEQREYMISLLCKIKYDFYASSTLRDPVADYAARVAQVGFERAPRVHAALVPVAHAAKKGLYSPVAAVMIDEHEARTTEDLIWRLGRAQLKGYLSEQDCEVLADIRATSRSTASSGRSVVASTVTGSDAASVGSAREENLSMAAAGLENPEQPVSAPCAWYRSSAFWVTSAVVALAVLGAVAAVVVTHGAAIPVIAGLLIAAKTGAFSLTTAAVTAGVCAGTGYVAASAGVAAGGVAATVAQRSQGSTSWFNLFGSRTEAAPATAATA